MSDISKQAGERIRYYRRQKGLTLEDIADKAGLNISFLGQVERAEKKPSLETIDKILRALEVSYEDFFSFNSDSKAIEESFFIDKIVFELKDRSEEQQKMVYEIIKRLLSFTDKNK